MTVIPELRAAGVRCFTREQWGSPQEAAGAYDRRVTTHPMPAPPADYHFLHITVTRDGNTIREGKEGAQQVEGYGYSTPPMVSYQDLVTNEGLYFEGQSYGVKGTHTVNDLKVPGFPRDLNLYGYATALMQNVGDEVTDRQVEVVAMIFAIRELKGYVRRGAPVLPHMMFAAKACPGPKALARLQDIVELKNRYVREGLPNKEDEMQDKDFERIREIVREEIDAQFSEQVLVKTPTGERRLSYTQMLKETLQRLIKMEKAS